MKDLATLRSPQSPLTFVNYLHSQGRLSAFINRGSLTPSRKEFADYLEWAARYVEAQGVNVNYGQEVVAIDESMDGLITVTSITLADGKLNSFITRKHKLSLYIMFMSSYHGHNQVISSSHRADVRVFLTW